MKKFFETPEVAVIALEVQDILTTSPGGDPNEGPFVPYNFA